MVCRYGATCVAAQYMSSTVHTMLSFPPSLLPFFLRAPLDGGTSHHEDHIRSTVHVAIRRLECSRRLLLTQHTRIRLR
jgi:hypothetical protein